jgi:ABC-type sugar transport system permease subunit
MKSKLFFTSLAFLAGGFASLCVVGAIFQLSVQTQDMIACREHLCASQDATDEDRAKLAELENSFWAKLPKWAVFVLAATTGIITLSGFFALTMASLDSLKLRRRIFFAIIVLIMIAADAAIIVSTLLK